MQKHKREGIPEDTLWSTAVSPPHVYVVMTLCCWLKMNSWCCAIFCQKITREFLALFCAWSSWHRHEKVPWSGKRLQQLPQSENTTRAARRFISNYCSCKAVLLSGFSKWYACSKCKTEMGLLWSELPYDCHCCKLMKMFALFFSVVLSSPPKQPLTSLIWVGRYVDIKIYSTSSCIFVVAVLHNNSPLKIRFYL